MKQGFKFQTVLDQKKHGAGDALKEVEQARLKCEEYEANYNTLLEEKKQLSDLLMNRSDEFYSMLLAGVVTGVQAKDKCIFLQRIKSDIKAKQQEMEDSSRQIMQLKEEVLLKEKKYFIARTEEKKYEFLKEHWVHL